MLNEGLYTSLKADWETPKAFFQRLNRSYQFTLDACANEANYKVANYYSPEDDALGQEWPGRVFMNPPYGREIYRWVRKAYEEAWKGSLVVCLLPARTDTYWWHDYVMRANTVVLIKGRLRFGPSDNPAPFPSCLVVFHDLEDFRKEMRIPSS